MWSFGSDYAACEGVLKLILVPSNKSDEVSLKKTLPTDCGRKFPFYGVRNKIFIPMQPFGKIFSDATSWHYLCGAKCHSSKFINTHHICVKPIQQVFPNSVESLHSRGYERQHFCVYDRLWQVQCQLYAGWYQLFHLETRDGFISTVQRTLQVHH